FLRLPPLLLLPKERDKGAGDGQGGQECIVEVVHRRQAAPSNPPPPPYLPLLQRDFADNSLEKHSGAGTFPQQVALINSGTTIPRGRSLVSQLSPASLRVCDLLSSP